MPGACHSKTKNTFQMFRSFEWTCQDTKAQDSNDSCERSPKRKSTLQIAFFDGVSLDCKKDLLNKSLSMLEFEQLAKFRSAKPMLL